MSKQKLAAVLEVIGILALGWLLTRIVVELLPLPSLDERLAAAVEAPRPDFLGLGLLAIVPLVVQSICLLGPAELVSRWLRRESLLGPRRRADEVAFATRWHSTDDGAP